MRLLTKSIALPLLVLLSSCGQGVGDGSSVSEENSQEKIARASQSLRLGQAATPDSPIAVSAAIDNLESVVVLNDGPGNTEVRFVLYTTDAGTIVRIQTDSLGRPVTVQTKDATATFSNYRGSDVDVAIASTNNTATIDALTLSRVANTSSLKRFLRAEENSSVLRTLLDQSANAVRLFGCAVQGSAAASGSSASFIQASETACKSLLVDAIRIRVDRNEIEQLPVTRDIATPSGCDFNQPGWADSFSSTQSCAARVSTVVLRDVITENPGIDSAVDDGFIPGEQFIDEFVDDDTDDVSDDDFFDNDGNFIGDEDEPVVDDGSETPIDDGEEPIDDGEEPIDEGEEEVVEPELPPPPVPGDPEVGNPND